MIVSKSLMTVFALGALAVAYPCAAVEPAKPASAMKPDQSLGDGPVILAVVSHLRDPASRSRFEELSRQTREWMYAQPGFIRYELFQLPDGYLDTMLWRTRADEEAARERFSHTEIRAGFAEIMAPNHQAVVGVVADWLPHDGPSRAPPR